MGALGWPGNDYTDTCSNGARGGCGVEQGSSRQLVKHPAVLSSSVDSERTSSEIRVCSV